MIHISKVDAFAYRVPLATPLKVSFGNFSDRPMVVVRLTDEDGAEGWGEIWCNWPAVGAEHRARLAVSLGEELIGQDFALPADLYKHLTRITEVLVLQAGEVGPVAQVSAGIDIAAWDLFARRQDLPLYRCLTDRDVARVPVYTTGLEPDSPERFAGDRYAEGHRAFKLKVGFGNNLDLRNMAAIRDAVGADAALMVDANQSFDAEAARAFSEAAEPFNVSWFEEPIRVDAPRTDWRALRDASPIPLAGGENLRGGQFSDWIAEGLLLAIQPDITKWGGVTRCSDVARQTAEAGLHYCPHVFGGGIATLASLHLLASARCEGALEFDCKPNAGRERIIGDLLPVLDGTVPVPQSPGLGVTPDLAALAEFRTWASV